jgi:hypothetical protein
LELLAELMSGGCAAPRVSLDARQFPGQSVDVKSLHCLTGSGQPEVFFPLTPGDQNSAEASITWPTTLGGLQGDEVFLSICINGQRG